MTVLWALPATPEMRNSNPHQRHGTTFHSLPLREPMEQREKRGRRSRRDYLRGSQETQRYDFVSEKAPSSPYLINKTSLFERN